MIHEIQYEVILCMIIIVLQYNVESLVSAMSDLISVITDTLRTAEIAFLPIAKAFHTSYRRYARSRFAYKTAINKNK